MWSVFWFYIWCGVFFGSKYVKVAKMCILHIYTRVDVNALRNCDIIWVKTLLQIFQEKIILIYFKLFNNLYFSPKYIYIYIMVLPCTSTYFYLCSILIILMESFFFFFWWKSGGIIKRNQSLYYISYYSWGT